MAVQDADSSNQDTPDALAAQTGDKNAFTRLIRRHESSLTRHLSRFTNNDAVLEDLRQETYLEAYRSLSTFRNQGPFPRWLRRIATRVGYRHWAKRAREAQAKMAFLELWRNDSPSSAEAAGQENVEQTEVLFACLNRHDRALMEMRYIQELTTREIAECLGWDAARVRVRLHRALGKIRSFCSRKNEP